MPAHIADKEFAMTFFQNTAVSRHLTPAAMVLCGMIAGFAPAAFAKDGHDNPGAAAVANTPAADHANKGNGGAGENNSHAAVLLAGVSPQPSGAAATLVFTNTGASAGTATVTLFDADTGASLGTWTSPSLPSFGSLPVSVGTVLAAATPVLTTSQIGGLINAQVSASFKGEVQMVATSAGGISDLTACGRRLTSVGRVLGNVAGPGNTLFADGVRIVNGGTAANHIVLTVHNAVDGTALGTWTSPDVAAHGSLTVSAAAIAAAATPVVGATTTWLTLSADQGGGLSLQHLSMLKGATGVTDLSSACRLSGGRAAAHDAADESDDAPDSDDK